MVIPMSLNSPSHHSSTPSPSPFTIRPAHASDIPTILALIHELAEYERAAHEVQATEASLLATLTFPGDAAGKGWARTLLISPSPEEKDGQDGDVAGFALYFTNYSTWRAAPGIYLEDLFVRPRYRGRGYGTALLQALAKECVAMQPMASSVGGRLEWSVLKWNEPSIKFYQGESVGAERMEEWVGMRVEGERLLRLAGTGEEKVAGA